MKSRRTCTHFQHRVKYLLVPTSAHLPFCYVHGKRATLLIQNKRAKHHTFIAHAQHRVLEVLSDVVFLVFLPRNLVTTFSEENPIYGTFHHVGISDS